RSVRPWPSPTSMKPMLAGGVRSQSSFGTAWVRHEEESNTSARRRVGDLFSQLPYIASFISPRTQPMQVSPQEFADLVSQAMQDPERLGSDPRFAVELLRVGSGYHLKPVGDAPKELILECYRTVYNWHQPTTTVVPPI